MRVAGAHEDDAITRSVEAHDVYHNAPPILVVPVQLLDFFRHALTFRLCSQT
ncbi:hypothetical protein D3C80_1882090 [compost metagenome]